MSSVAVLATALLLWFPLNVQAEGQVADQNPNGKPAVTSPQKSRANLELVLLTANTAGLEHADIVVAVLDGSDADSGTSWEVGWPRRPPPHATTIAPWLDHALETGQLNRDGKGKRANPFRYWLPSKIESWRADPLSRLLMPELFDESGKV
jgi:hypothetical protein